MANANDFFATKALMPNGELKETHLEDYHGSYALLLFYPGFSPLAKSELLAFAEQNERFASNECQVHFRLALALLTNNTRAISDSCVFYRVWRNPC